MKASECCPSVFDLFLLWLVPDVLARAVGLAYSARIIRRVYGFFGLSPASFLICLIDSHESCCRWVGARRDSQMGFLFRMNRCHGGSRGAPTLVRL